MHMCTQTHVHKNTHVHINTYTHACIHWHSIDYCTGYKQHTLITFSSPPEITWSPPSEKQTDVIWRREQTWSPTSSSLCARTPHLVCIIESMCSPLLPDVPHLNTKVLLSSPSSNTETLQKQISLWVVAHMASPFSKGGGAASALSSI